MLENVEVLCHSAIRINKGATIYVDPYMIEKEYNDADYIFITHEHYDHFSKEDIDKVRKENSIIIIPEDMRYMASEIGFKDDCICLVTPNNEYKLDGLSFKTIPAYNVNKAFHPKDKNYVGYIITIDYVSYYIAGDTDITEENMKVVCDVAFVPVGGKYTMTCKEAAKLVNTIKPKLAVPTHYGAIIGNTYDAIEFMQLINEDILGKILIK